MYDIAVLGGGPGGYGAAIRAAQLGAKVALIEKDELGGTCLNRGCVPMKTYLHESRAFYRFHQYARDNGIEVGDAILPKTITEKKNSIVDGLNRGIKGLLKKYGVELLHAEGKPRDSQVIELDDGGKVESKHIIIAAGSHIPAPPFEIRDGSRLINSDHVFSRFEVPKSIMIIGGGVIGVEMAQYFRHLDSCVKILEREMRLLPMFDHDVSDGFLQYFKSIGIDSECGCSVKSIDGEEVVYIGPEGDEKIARAQLILCCTGRQSNGKYLELDRLGIKHRNHAIITDDQMKTSVDRIYAVGDVNARSMLAHSATAQGITAACSIMGLDTSMDNKYIPQCVYTDLEVGCCGLTEQEAKNLGIPFEVKIIPFTGNAKAIIEGYPQGFVKLIATCKYREILGVHILAPGATEMIHACVVAMAAEITADELARYIFAHPTLSEAISEAAQGISGFGPYAKKR